MSVNSTADQILFALKTRGGLSAKQIADTFQLSVMGAHKALNALGENGLVTSADHSKGRGRPTRVFTLTAAGHARFPDNHADLSIDLINDVKTVFGQEGLDRIIAQREQRQRQSYARLQGKPLPEKVAALADIRSDEGYMARSERQEDGSFLLVEDHCPICAAAEACQGFCRSELALFQEAMGEDVTVSREEHLLSGGRRCTYRVRQKESS